jgi:mRNA-degrading endonuclease RelE of RelBE toxin-antitoxin system
MNEKYKIEFSLQADKFLSEIDKSSRKKIIRKIEWLEKNCEIINHRPLQYEFKDYFKLKLGKIRIIYKIFLKRKAILIAYIDFRDRIYKIYSS